ncbi:hypothetical protein [Bradyrhizobium sp. WYCCWR 12699]|uniref:hypothetical protein n=1 Tax=Bradyrhizobium sp. WYCCWR 12699 TaxID=3064203 RepID=UPI0028A44635|nr:hypothetical protein [Bradyrhizobium sp. WYCCWR 12699]MDT4739926.1 hypothetical protein [Bradyrhizobium sp. WYCCWR 12699]
MDIPEPLVLPDVRALPQMPSLPGWVVSRLGLVKMVEQRSERDGKFHQNLPALPRSSLLSPPEREAIETYAVDLQQLCNHTAKKNDRLRSDLLAIIARIMLGRPSSPQNELGVEASGEDYFDTLEDVPIWSLSSSYRRWLRGEVGLGPDGRAYVTQWRPDPTIWRRIALEDVYKVQSRIARLRILLKAEPLAEYDEAHRARMSERFAELLATLKGCQIH